MSERIAFSPEVIKERAKNNLMSPTDNIIEIRNDENRTRMKGQQQASLKLEGKSEMTDDQIIDRYP